jgi:hypothetical protein
MANGEVSRILRTIRQVEDRTKGKIKNAIEDVLLDLQRRAIERAPIDTGDLRGSSSVEVVERNGMITGTIGFNTPYAMKQHEDLTLNHPRGGEAKYIEKPLKENEARYKQFVKDAVREGVL